MGSFLVYPEINEFELLRPNLCHRNSKCSRTLVDPHPLTEVQGGMNFFDLEEINFP
jgi:hypothetical protein